MRAKPSRLCCLEDTGSSTTKNTGVKVNFRTQEVVTGEEECATTQTVHFAASIELE